MDWLVGDDTRRVPRGLRATPSALARVLACVLLLSGVSCAALEPFPVEAGVGVGAAQASAVADVANASDVADAWAAENASDESASPRALLDSSENSTRALLEDAPLGGARAAGDGSHPDVLAAAIDALRRGGAASGGAGAAEGLRASEFADAHDAAASAREDAFASRMNETDDAMPAREESLAPRANESAEARAAELNASADAPSAFEESFASRAGAPAEANASAEARDATQGSLVPQGRAPAPANLRVPPPSEVRATLEALLSAESEGAQPAWLTAVTRAAAEALAAEASEPGARETNAREPDAMRAADEFIVQTGLLSDNVRELVKDFGWRLKWPDGSDRRIEAPFAIPRDTLEATLRRLLELYEGSFVADLYQANRMVVVAPAPPGVAIRESDDAAQPARQRRNEDARAERTKGEQTWLRFPEAPDDE